MKYPVIQDPAPWNNPRELGITVNVNGTDIIAVPFLDAVTGDVLIGESGFEADDPYVLARTEDVTPLGDLHGLPVTIGTESYIIRNVRPKPGIDMTRLVLRKVS